MSGRRRSLIPVVAAVVALSAAAAPAGAHYQNPGAKKCAAVAFQQDTDSGASAIKAKRTSCRKARRLARRVHFGRGTSGWSCKSRTHDEAGVLAHMDWKCKRGRRVVTWAAT